MKRFFPSLLLILIVLTTVLTPRPCHGEAAATTLRVGSEVEFPPFALVDDKGRPAGFSVDLIRAVTHAMGMEISIATDSWDNVWSGLISGRFDVLPLVAKLPDRQRVVDFTLPHTETFDAFFVREGTPEIRNISEAEGKRIVVMRSDAAHHALIERRFRGELILTDTIPEGLSLVAAGKYDAFLCSKLIGVLAIQKHGIKGLKAGPLIRDYKRSFSFAVRKGNDELREKLNQGLLIVKSSGEYNRIYEKWLGYDDPWLKYRKYFFLTMPVAMAAIVAAVLWLMMLRVIVKRRTAELSSKNVLLEQEIIARRRLEEELNKHRGNLEEMVAARTRELRESEEKFRHLFHNAQVGMFRTRLDGSEILDMNDHFLKIFGRAREEMQGTSSAIHWADQREREEMVRRLEADGRVVDLECRMLNRRGEVRTCLTSLILYREQGILEGSIVDITERRQAEEAMTRMGKLEALGTLAGGIAHDFNNMLGSLFGYMELSQIEAKKTDNKKIARYLDEALGAFDRAKGLTAQLITFSKGGSPIKKRQPLSACVREIVSASLSGSGIEASFHIPDGIWPCIFDEGQIAQALGNIVINARQASPAGGGVDVTVGNVAATEAPALLPPGNYVRISVRDYGSGIRPEDLPRIFDPFFSTRSVGRGLGLAISHSIIRQHDGFIDVESEPDKGTTVHIYLPAAPDSPTAPQETGPRKGKGKILVMDDEEQILEVASMMLQEMGYDTVTVRHASEAVQAVTASIRGNDPFVCLILDLTIPGEQGGKDVIGRLLKLDPSLKAIVSSGYADDPVMSRPYAYGFVASLSKPYQQKDLSRALASVLGTAQ